MSQKLLDEFSPSHSLSKASPLMETITKDKLDFSSRAPSNLPPAYFVSATYDGKTGNALIKLYEPISEKIYFWYDNTRHKPYCLTNLSPSELENIPRLIQHPGFDHFDIVNRFDPLLDKTVQLTKIITKDPLAIGGRPKGCIRDIIPEDFPKISGISPEKIKVWESKIKYYQSYIYDRNLIPGMIYEIENGNLVEKRLVDPEKTIQNIQKSFLDQVNSEELTYIEQWTRLLEYPIPRFYRVALDIEVYTPIPKRMPNPSQAAYPVVCASMYDSQERKKVLLLKRNGMSEGTEHLPAEVACEYFGSEADLIQKIFEILEAYPFVITFNGNDFDLRYLTNRAKNLGFRTNEIPIDVRRRVCLLKYGIHIDLYRFFFNRSIKIYAFNNDYRDLTLDDVGKALVGMGKIELKKEIGELSYTELAKYCLKDTEITYKLTSFDDDLVMKLILILSRISSMSMEDVNRLGVSRWIKNFLYREHRKRGLLIPNASEIRDIKGKTVTKAAIKGKKYKGAIVVQPVPGIHFNVAVMDFPSLYPSIIKVWNLGYQSISCPHPECQSNLIPDTPHWVCTQKKSLESLLIGSLRDLRVHWYKPKSKDGTLSPILRNWYSVIQRALKVILNASYGVFGSESFDLYCPPVAEATAAIGRHAITQIIKKAKNLGIHVLYGDTDSIFLKNPTKGQTNELGRWTELELKMNLDVDKSYRYVVFSSRKKNYLGVLDDGSVDVKGLTGKKRHTPSFIKKAFDEMKVTFALVKNPIDFETAKKKIRAIVSGCYTRLKRREWNNLNELAFNVMLGAELSHYTKTTPQHVKAARILEENGVEIRAGDLISFVKIVKEPHVKPVELAKKKEIDVDKYIAYLNSTFDQILEALDLDFNEILGLTKLERFM